MLAPGFEIAFDSSHRNLVAGMTFQTDSSLIPPQAPVPAGGVASPPTDPPAASGRPLQGQEETNRPITPIDETPDTTRYYSEEDKILWRAAAMDLGRTTYFR